MLYLRGGQDETTPYDLPIDDDAPSTIANEAKANLQLLFGSSKSTHRPSGRQFDAICRIILTLDDMAHGRARDRFYLASMDPGMGKTTALITYVRALVGNPEYRGVGVIIFLSRKDEIERLVSEMALRQEQFAVLTSDPDCNNLSTTYPTRAQVLFTTQQRLELNLVQKRGFEDISDFLYQPWPSRPACLRAVRVWDESAIPGHAVTLTQHHLSSISGLVGRHGDHRLSEAIDSLRSDVMALDNKATYDVPDISSLSDSMVETVKGWAKEEELKVAIGSLWFLSGRVVTVRRDWGNRVCLDYRDVFTDDLKPMLILDASGRVRETYKLWQLGHRGDLVRLPDAPKSYRNLTLRVWNKSGSKTGWKNETNRQQMVSGIVATLNQRPDETWLVVTHKPDTIRLKGQRRGDPSLHDEILSGFLGDRSRVHFVTWGEHTATNAHRSVRNVIIAGLFHLPQSALEATGRAAAGRPSSDGTFPEASVSEVERGEHRHNVLQALCRASVRNSEGDGCGECQAYVIAPTRGGLKTMLRDVFPGCRIEDWNPAGEATKPPIKGLTIKQEMALAYVRNALEEDPSALIPFGEVALVVGMSPKNFRRQVRADARFALALLDCGIAELSQGRCRSGFARGGRPLQA